MSREGQRNLLRRRFETGGGGFGARRFAVRDVGGHFEEVRHGAENGRILAEEVPGASDVLGEQEAREPLDGFYAASAPYDYSSEDAFAARLRRRRVSIERAEAERVRRRGRSLSPPFGDLLGEVQVAGVERGVYRDPVTTLLWRGSAISSDFTQRLDCCGQRRCSQWRAGLDALAEPIAGALQAPGHVEDFVGGRGADDRDLRALRVELLDGVLLLVDVPTEGAAWPAKAVRADRWRRTTTRGASLDAPTARRRDRWRLGRCPLPSPALPSGAAPCRAR